MSDEYSDPQKRSKSVFSLEEKCMFGPLEEQGQDGEHFPMSCLVSLNKTRLRGM